MPHSVITTSKAYSHPIPLDANRDRCCRPSGLDSVERSGRLEWNANPVPIALTRVEVTINRTTDQDLTPQTSRNGSLACIEEQLFEKSGKRRGLDESGANDVVCQRQAPL